MPPTVNEPPAWREVNKPKAAEAASMPGIATVLFVEDSVALDGI